MIALSAWAKPTSTIGDVETYVAFAGNEPGNPMIILGGTSLHIDEELMRWGTVVSSPSVSRAANSTQAVDLVWTGP